MYIGLINGVSKMRHTLFNRLEDLNKACENILLCETESKYPKEELITYYNSARVECECLLDVVIKRLNKIDSEKRYAKGD